MTFEHELTLDHFGLPHVGGQQAVVNQFEDRDRIQFLAESCAVNVVAKTRRIV